MNISYEEKKSKILSLIKKAQEIEPSDFFMGGVEEERILNLERTLDVNLSESYKWFLREFGHGGIGGVEILGDIPGEVCTCVRDTIELRKHGLPLSHVVIENVDEYYMCLDTYRMDRGECPVVDWDFRGESYMVYKNFLDYTIDKFENQLDDIEYQNEC
ncbi:SMI1/KNR4 family protein [Mechercharimyces sp. CAU 1602]|uniref:SMI1/KNR4 family protein n=1 Tax=Mechercharimyces sp. CAU 1602 TaxID=2973933 RepID=UPI0021622CB2|nr:SMI1/KNR4 family protein [Mechercharimyces sp. CAU 1602]MCS1350903.1 SMI1/KNR4 family protein [Mechercharimyces sp. CAU 1602]